MDIAIFKGILNMMLKDTLPRKWILEKERKYFIMNKDINEILTQIEVTLLNQESPEYIEVSYQSGYIYVLSSREDYKYYSLRERITGIFYLLQFEHADILAKYPIIVETYDSNELTELFKMYSSKK